MGAHAVLLYLYLASNSDGFRLALSPAAIRDAIGMPASTYRDQFVKLVDKGYLVQKGSGNLYDFYEVPQKRVCNDGIAAQEPFDTSDAVPLKAADSSGRTAENIEINI